MDELDDLKRKYPALVKDFRAWVDAYVANKTRILSSACGRWIMTRWAGAQAFRAHFLNAKDANCAIGLLIKERLLPQWIMQDAPNGRGKLYVRASAP